MISSNSKTSNILLTLAVLFTIAGAARFLPVGAIAEDSGAHPDYTPETVAVSTDAAEGGSLGVLDRTSPDASKEIRLSAEAAEAVREDLAYIETERTKLTEAKLSLAADRVELENRERAIEDLQARMAERWEKMQATSNEDMTHLAKMYGSMKPSQAAQIFDKMDPTFAAGFLRMISSDQAGLVMAEMNTQQAYIVSIELANMNADLR